MFDGLKEEYRNYSAWVARYRQNESTGQRIFKFVTGNREFNKRSEHTQFCETIKAQAEVLLAQVRNGEENPVLLPALLNYVFIDCYTDTDKVSSLMFLAAEQLFLPHIEFLKPEDAQSLYLAYKKQRRKDPGLPVQGRIQKRLNRVGPAVTDTKSVLHFPNGDFV